MKLKKIYITGTHKILTVPLGHNRIKLCANSTLGFIQGYITNFMDVIIFNLSYDRLSNSFCDAYIYLDISN